ncbi:bifunctional acetaldehyde-CoA/alcohol dehydrogenase [Bacillus sp. AFS076308]|uniref:bifunctional acetaldehyde-CoA/alcohol dehydrogenase n=1 Tax=unclassified Bacillus (in: firmicutes) TaxID=185979 RepID=UPI000BF9E2C5|nr:MULTISPECIES: bifunctional acetaldehyde-CoA/alcohol dehydrogenase [unclassified Bacillus (in: firmicutes)]PFO06397.1 bifunctional acetaldehyde-CoA/alcohol dehydrogenase [Bacillus sp. AFS076308]PGV49427.1 bifunctional acetaldehyde-CoA/alcohol dehydrogenase [Bacillus sp. AFS037270]
MAVEEKVVQEKQIIAEAINLLANNAEKALAEFRCYTQEMIDKIVKEMALAALENHKQLAKLAVTETRRGIYEDKVFKNMFATEFIYNNIRDMKTVGVISEDENEGMVEIAEPVGVIAGVIPITNPTSTVIFKSLISLKTRNPIIFAFPQYGQKCCTQTAKILKAAAMRAGAPENCIQWIEEPSHEAFQTLMRHPKISLILATGGPNLVKAAYRSGKPALGVGAGNVPCYIEKTANIKRAVNDVILSKTFDNGMICASEQSLIIDQEIFNDVKQELISNNCYFLSVDERKMVEKAVIFEKTGSINNLIVGLPAAMIAKLAGIKVPVNTKILIAELEGVGPNEPLSCEKLSPILACYKVTSFAEGLRIAEETLEYGGLGHSAAIHTSNQELVDIFSLRLKAGRIMVNTPSTHGAIGDIYNTSLPSLTIGCGTYGGNSVSQNVGAQNLINIKKVAKRRTFTQWFKVPSQVFFEKNSVQTLASIPGITKAFIVTSGSPVKNGYVDKVLYYLKKNQISLQFEIYSNIEQEPSVETVMDGAERVRKFQPDCIIALGGGSVMDAAKAMWLFYEHPDTDFRSLTQKFFDPTKRVVKFPVLRTKAKFVAIPTTSGTGSEVTAFSVITDKKANIKYPLADFQLTPDVAIVDPQFVMTVPNHVTADTGMDVLTHAIESYVSVLANDFTDGLALKAIQLVFQYLPRAYRDGGDEIAREKMHNASTIAGMAFANSFLGINHSLSHVLGAEFNISHGRTNAILLPHVIRYNAAKPNKFMTYPKYEHFIADERYAEIARMLGLPASTTEEGIESLIKAVVDLAKELDISMSVQANGVNKEEFESKLAELAERAFDDQDTIANPKQPFISELAEIYQQAFKGI